MFHFLKINKKKKKNPLHPCPLHSQVRQWIADRVTGNSSPGSPSTFSYPGSSSTPDWSTPRRERSSPLRGPHGKFVSPSSLGAYSLSSSPPDQGSSQRSRSERHTDMAELAKHVSEHHSDVQHFFHTSAGQSTSLCLSICVFSRLSACLDRVLSNYIHPSIYYQAL